MGQQLNTKHSDTGDHWLRPEPMYTTYFEIVSLKFLQKVKLINDLQKHHSDK